MLSCMPVSRADRLRARFEKRLNEFATYESLKGAGTAFVGDSLVQNAPWSELLPREPSLNFGVKSDDAERVHERCAAVIDVEPARIILLVGTNDIQRGTTDTVVAWIDRMVTIWQASLPNVSIGILAVPPRAAALMDSVHTLNHDLVAYARRRGLAFLNENATLRGDDGALDPRWALDAVHLNKAGYRAWIRALRPQLRRFGVDVRPEGPPAELTLVVAKAIAAEEDYDWDELDAEEQTGRLQQASFFLIAEIASRQYERERLASRTKKPRAATPNLTVV